MATAAAAGTGTKEYQAIKLHYATLVNTLGKTVDPADFARKLGEKSLISDGEFHCQAPFCSFLSPTYVHKHRRHANAKCPSLPCIVMCVIGSAAL